ncbi:MAG: response regulator [Blastochloris sp.]|nr:response regulator [Blastochloris sp.]
MKLLIVDDSSIVRRSIQKVLDASNITEVDQAKNGLEALEIFRLKHHDAVTLDITMPVMDGLICVEELIKINPDARILIISALADKATAIDAVKRGASGFICKPFTSNDLADCFQELIS